MRSSTVIALAAVAVPALGAPLPLDTRANGKWTKVLENVNNAMGAAAGAANIGATIYGATKMRREDLELEAREDELEARANGKWTKVLENVNNAVGAAASAADIGATIYGATKMRRDELELEAREDELEARANGKWTKVLENVNNAVGAAASAADIGTTIYGAVKNHKRILPRPRIGVVVDRDFDELEAREDELEARANGKWTKVLENVNNAVGAAASAADIGATIYGATKMRREDLELEAREDELEARANGKWTKVLENVNNAMGAAAGAANIGATIYGATKMRRDEFYPEFEARDDELEARANGKWTKVLENVNNAMGAAAGAANIGATIYGATKMRRDELELLAREEELEARANGKWTKVLENVNNAMGAAAGAANIGATIYGATKMRRDFDELEAREAELDARANGKWTKVLENVNNAMGAAAGAANIGATIYGATKMRRDFDELEAREDELEARANGKWTKVIENVNNAMGAAAGAANIGATIYGASKMRRDFDELEAREAELEARANGKWTKVLENVNNAVGAAASAADIGTTIYGAVKSGKREVSLNDLL